MFPIERKRDRRSLHRVARIQEILSTTPMDVQELAIKTAGCLGVTRRYITELHQQKAIHVSGWAIHMTGDRKFGVLCPQYSWGGGADAVPVSVLVETPAS